MTTALLIIDVQEALCTGEYAAFEAKLIIERINLVYRNKSRCHISINDLY